MEDYEEQPAWLRTWRWTLASLAAVGAVAVVLYLAYPTRSAPRPTVDSAIVFVADISSSMDDEERRILRLSHAEAIASSEVMNAVRNGDIGRSVFAYVEFASRAEVVIGWTVIETDADAAEFASILIEHAEHPYDLGTITNIGNGLRAAHELMQELREEPLFRTVDVVGDGTGDDHWVTPRQDLLDMGVTINGLPIVLRPDDDDLVEWYSGSLIGGPRSFSLPIHGMGEMPMKLRQKLVSELY